MKVISSASGKGASVQQTDRSTFEAQYRLHSSGVFTHFLQRGVPRSEAEDLTSEVFASTWRRRADITPHPSAGMLPWLLGTANVLLRGRRRSLWRAGQALGRLPSPETVPDIADALTDQAQDEHRLQVLREVLTALTVPEQEVLQLCVLRGLAPTVVAEVTGEPAGTVRSRLSRALTKARTRYIEVTGDQSDPVMSPRRAQ